MLFHILKNTKKKNFVLKNFEGWGPKPWLTQLIPKSGTATSRLKHSQFHSNDQILLLPKSCLTHLIIMQSHQAVKHGGMAETLTEFRNQFWLPKGRQIIKQVLHSCFHCPKLKSKL